MPEASFSSISFGSDTTRYLRPATDAARGANALAAAIRDPQTRLETLKPLAAALAVHREIGNRRSEGVILGALGNLRIEQRRLAEARSYLDAFSGAPQDPLAPHALYKLALSLGELGQVNEACLTLTEVDSRYPGSEVAGDVAAKRQALACQ